MTAIGTPRTLAFDGLTVGKVVVNRSSTSIGPAQVEHCFREAGAGGQILSPRPVFKPNFPRISVSASCPK
jgi:hypothetical protein